jgi:hypothetical protein
VEEIMDYIHELERMFNQLDELFNYGDEKNNINQRVKSRLSNLFIAGRMANFYPLLMVAHDQYKRGSVSGDEFCRLLRKVETFIVRTYIIEQKSVDTGRTRPYPLARRLHYNTKEVISDSVSPLDIDGVVSRLERYINDYCSDSRLNSTLGEENVYKYFQGSNRLNELRLLLFAYESHLESREEDIQFHANEVVSNKDDRFSIEHVWPQTPGEKFDDETKELVKEHTHLLGNLALMTPEDNAVKGNDPFNKKKDKFTGSKIRMLEQIFAKDGWGVGHINEREQNMLDVIRTRWPGRIRRFITP